MNGNTLLNDACYEFNAQGSPQVLSIFQNSQGIIVCDNQYHPDHIYCSAYFDSNGQPISFWIFDTDYRDNSGSLQVEIYEVGTGAGQTHGQVQIPPVTQGSGAFCPIGPADRLVWTGNVDSRGQRITSPQLVAGNKYYIVVRGTLSEGTWYVNGNTLLNDACYEFNAQGSPQVLSIFQNSQGIIVCDNQYHPDHIYCSAYFDSNGQPISFWIFDTDYRDNSGSLQVEIYEVGTGAGQTHGQVQIPPVTQGSGAFCPIGPADRLVWTGNVDSRGQRITSPQLVAGNKYYIVVRGTLSEGTWYVNGNTLLNDACYEFNAQGSPQVLSIFQNSQGIIVCDNQYHPDHIYCSAYFDSNGQPISFWIFDTDYRDNSGSLQVEIYEVGTGAGQTHGQVQIPPVTQGSGAFCPIGPADRLVWTGNVDSRGQRITSPQLVAGNKYYIVVRGTLSEGTWYVNGNTLLNDACYEFNARAAPRFYPFFKTARELSYVTTSIIPTISIALPISIQTDNHFLLDFRYRLPR